ncbi:MAG: AsmA family protein [Proteobacteria bacterium]|nr:AsmA family protein [Pseudomonadota bacterium]
MRLRWKISLIVGIVAVFAAALALLPRLVDVEAYKPGMIEAVRAATGRELVIDGPMRLSLFPVPGIGAGDVHFSNAVGAEGAQMIDVRWVAVTPSWWALLQGRIEVGTLTLYRPTIVLETDEAGRPNWQFEPGAGIEQPAGAPSKGMHLAIGRLAIVNGKITYRNPRGGGTIVAEDVRVGATVASFDGPFEIDGTATVNRVPLKLGVSVGGASAKGHPTDLTLEVSSGKLHFKGALDAVKPDTTARGHLTVETGLLSDFVASLWSALGGSPPDFNMSGAGRFLFDGDVVASLNGIAANDFDVRVGHDAAAGSLSLGLLPSRTLSGRLSLSRIDVDKWLLILNRPMDFAPAAVKEVIANRPKPATSPWAEMDADLTVDVAEAVYRGDVVRNLAFVLGAKKGVVSLPRASATLPGGMKVEIDSGAGRLSLQGNDLRRTLGWLDVDVAGVPTALLQSLHIDGKIAALPGSLRIADGRFALDGTPGTMAGTVSLKAPGSAALQVEMNRFDLEAYLPKPQGGRVTIPAAAAALSPPDKNAPAVGLKLKIANLAFRGETLKDVQGEATAQGNLLQLAGFRIADAAGARLDLRGAVQDIGTAPRFDLAFNVAASDADRLLDYVQLPRFLNGRIGPATASGAVSGTLSAVTARDVAVNFLNMESRVSGAVSFGQPVSYDLSSFFLHTKEAGPLLSVASGRSMSNVGYIRATGSLKGTWQKAAFEGEIRTRGSRLNGRLEATLDAHPKVVADFKVPGVLKIDRWLGIDPKSVQRIAPVEGGPAPTPSPTTQEPIDLAPFRAFDAKLTLQAEEMTLASLTLDHAAVEGTLSNGIVKLARLTGDFYGGMAAFEGTIDASGQMLSIDLTGDLHGMALDRFLLATMGKNRLSSSGFSIAIDGKVDATGLHITGQGISSQDIRNALSGAGLVSGYLHPVVVEGSTGFAHFAASVGGVFSAGLAFDAQVLKSFLDRQNPITGHMALSAGGLTMQDQKVTGANAVASINGRASFADDTIDTTITLDSGSDRFVTKVKGSLASPDLSTTRNKAP